MQLLVRGVHLHVDTTLYRFVEVHLERALRVFQQQAVAVEVHLVDTNSAKGGVDQSARVTLRVPGVPALHVEETADDVHKAVLGACERLEHVAKRWLDKRHHHSGGPSLADLPVEEET